jgi:hypothetical protein
MVLLIQEKRAEVSADEKEENAEKYLFTFGSSIIPNKNVLAIWFLYNPSSGEILQRSKTELVFLDTAAREGKFFSKRMTAKMREFSTTLQFKVVFTNFDEYTEEKEALELWETMKANYDTENKKIYEGMMTQKVITAIHIHLLFI